MQRKPTKLRPNPYLTEKTAWCPPSIRELMSDADKMPSSGEWERLKKSIEAIEMPGTCTWVKNLPFAKSSWLRENFDLILVAGVVVMLFGMFGYIIITY